MGKLLKFIIILIAILIAIGYFSGEEVSSSDNQTSSAAPISEFNEQCESGYYKNSSNADCIKVPENALSVNESWYCKSGYYKNKTKTTCLKEDSSSISNKIPKNAYATALESRGWKCTYGYKVSGNSCVKATSNKKESTKKVTTSKSKPDRWWEKTDKYKICYGNITAAHKANGLHDRNRTLSIKVKEEMCKITATSTTGEGCAWLNNCK